MEKRKPSIKPSKESVSGAIYQPEHVLEQNDQQYHSLVDNTPDIITRWNRKLELFYANRAYTIWSAEAPNGDSSNKHSVSGERDDALALSYREPLTQVFETGRETEHYNSFSMPQGELHFHSRLVPEKNAQGEVVSVLAIARDITDLRRAQEEVLSLKDALTQRATDKYKALFNSIDEGFALAEVVYLEGNAVDLRFLEVNPAFQEHTGYFNIRRKTIRQMSPADAQEWIDSLHQLLQTEESIHFEKYNKTVNRWHRIYASKFGGANSRKVAIVLNDITERKRLELNAAFMAEIQDELSRLTSAAEIIQMFGEKLGDYMHIAAAYFAMIDEDSDEASFHTVWRSSKEDTFPFPPKIFMRDFAVPEFIKSLSAGETAISFNTQTDPMMHAEACRSLNIHSVVVVPFHRYGEWKYVLAISTTESRSWRPDEIELFRELSNRFFPRLERAYAEQSLRESERKYRTLFETMDQGFGVCEMVRDESGKAIDFIWHELNPALEKHTGLQRDAIVGRRSTEVFPDLDTYWLELYDSVLQSGTPKRAEYYVREVDRWLDCNVFPYSGNRLAVLYEDITPRKLIEEALRKREAELARVQEIGGIAGIDILLEGQPVGYRSPEYIKLHGLLPDKIVETQDEWFARVDPEDRERANKTFFEAIQSGVTSYEAEYRIIRPIDGQMRWIFTKNDIERDEHGKAIRMIGAHIDITERKRNEEALRESEKQLRDRDQLLTRLTDVTPSLLSRCSRDLHYLFVNRTTASFLGFEPEEIVGKSIREILGDSALEKILPYVERVLGGDRVEFELEVPYQTAGKHFMHVVYVPERDASGEVVGWFATVTDITERRKAEEFLRQSEKQLKEFNERLEEQVAKRTAELESSKDLLQTVYDTTINAFAVFDAVRNEEGEVIDFRYVSQNALSVEHARGAHTGKLFNDLYTSDSAREIFSQLKDVMDSGRNADFEIRYQNEYGEGWYRVKAVKTGDGIVSAGEDITERKKSELKINEQHNLITKLTEMMPDLIGIIEVPSQKGIFFNREPFSIHGFDLETLSKMSLEEKIHLTHPDDIRLRREYHERLGKKMDDEVLTYEYRVKNNRDEYLWLRVRGRVFERNADGTPKSVMSIVQNITEQRIANEKIREQNHLITKLTEMIPDIIGVSELGTNKILFVNREPWAQSGFDLDELLKMTPEERLQLIHPDDLPAREEYHRNIAQKMDDGILTYETRGKNKRGEWQWFSTRGRVFARNEDGTPQSVVSIVQNITEQRLSEEKIKEQNRFITAITETIPDMIGVTDYPSRRLRYVNREAFALQGFDVDIMKAMTIEERDALFHPDDRAAVVAFFERFGTMSNDDVATLDYRAKNQAGEWLWLRISGKVFERGHDGNVTAVLNVIQNITEQKLAELELVKQEAFIRNITMTMPDIVSVVALPSRRVEFMNKMVTAGYSVEEINAIPPEKRLDVFVMHEDQPAFMAFYKQLETLAEEELATVEYRTQNKDGSIVWTRARGKVIARNPDRTPSRALLIGEDITFEKLSEKTIETQNRFITAVTETVPDMISVMDYPSRKLQYFNREAFSVQGFNADDLLRMTAEERANLVHQDDQQPMRAYFESFASMSNDDLATLEYRARNKNGDLMWFLARGKVFERDMEGSVTAILNVVQNITVRKEIEDAILEKNIALENFRRIAESSYDAVISLDKSGHVTSWNPAAEHLYGYSTAEMMGKELCHILVPEHKRKEHEDLLLKVKKGKTIADFHTKRMRKNGDILDIQLTLFPLRDEVGTYLGSCKIARNVTELLRAQENIKELNQQLRMKNRQLGFLNSELQTFNQVASHDYSETLRNIYLNLEHALIGDAKNISSTSRAHLRKAQSAIQKMKLLTEDILAYTKVNEAEGVHQQIDLNILIKTVLEDYSDKITEYHAQIECSEMATVTGYPSLITLVLRHLIDNALKFRKENRSPHIRVKCEALKLTQMATNDQSKPGIQYVVLSVSDDGIGFSVDDTEKIFESFTRLNEDSKYRGSGIGLAICKKIMEMHDGFITAESDPGHGATFKCFFPIAD